MDVIGTCWVAALAMFALLQEPKSEAPVVVEEEQPLEEEVSPWLDPDDGWFDISSFLEAPSGFLPIVVPITEPALGYGLVGGAAFLDPREEAGEEGWARPNMTFVGGMWTEGGSEGGFAADSRLWEQGRIQSLAGAGVLSLDLDYFGRGADSELQTAPLEYTLDLWGGLAEGRVQLGESDLWAALRFAYAETEARFGADPPPQSEVDPRDAEVTLAGPSVSLRHDSLDNFFTPTSGTLAQVTGSFFDDAFGGDRDFQLVQMALIHHWPFAEGLFLGGRAELGLAFGDTPFYARPFIRQRGIPALRYQGDEVLSGELELRWQFHPRFSVLGFGGGGRAWSDVEVGAGEQGAFAAGAGVRYLVARRFGLHLGLDFAYGQDGGAVYVQFGNAWLRP